jgi:hypothetical protein
MVTTRQRPRAAAEITIRCEMVDGNGLLLDEALREIRHALDGIPPTASLVVNLGPLRHPDELLVRYLSALPCSIKFVSPNWRVAGQAWRLLVADLDEVA